MGTLIASAVPRLRCPEEANLRSPQSVVDLHLGFIRAGAELIETNTFGANRRKLAGQFLEQELEQINPAGEARATHARCWTQPSTSPARSAPSATWATQRTSVSGPSRSRRPCSRAAGVDLFMVETFYRDLAELEQVVEAVRSVRSSPSSRC